MQFRTNLVQEAFGARSHYGKEVVPYACDSPNRGSAVAGYEVSWNWTGIQSGGAGVFVSGASIMQVTQ